MEILDPDLWNDDGTPKRPSQQYMRRLEEMQDLEALDPETSAKRQAELDEAMRLYRTHAKAERIPEIGDIVHALDVWEGEGPEREAICRAAIVMETDGVTTELRVHIPHKAYEDWATLHDEHKAGMDTWHWPCGEGK